MLTDKVTIIKLKEKDWQVLKNIRLESLREEPDAFNSKHEEVGTYADGYWQEKLRDENLIFAVAVAEDRVVGVMSVDTREEDGVAAVHGAYVNKDYRRARIGKRLLEFLIIETIKINGIKKMRLWVRDMQLAAIRLYLGCGFRFVDIEDQGMRVMEKRLGQGLVY